MNPIADRLRASQKFFFGLLLAFLAATLFSCSKSADPLSPDDRSMSPFIVSDDVREYTFSVVNEYPHDPQAFTQGLIFAEGILYEGTGLRGSSSLRRVNLQTGEVLQKRDLDGRFFGEGITLYEDRMIQLTWTSQVGFVYGKTSFDLLREFDYPTQGWGITHDGERLIMSDGTSNLYFLDPATFQRIGQVEVIDEGARISNLNELEYIQGRVFANVWRTDRIAVIDPESGVVTNWVDLSGLLKPEDRTQPVDVLNGIAFDSDSDRLFVTGKLWPKLFELVLVPKSD